MADIDVNKFLEDRLFGGNEIEIKPRGNVDLTFGLFYQRIDNPNLSENFRRQPLGFDFDMDINMGVEGKIGDKLNLGFDYNTQATFDFDNKLNLGYGSDVFDEDDIIKTIEAGNVSLPLKGELIKGVQNLFGLKTELQFGKFWLTAIAATQRSEQEEISLQNGKLINEFELRPDDYDENRHFFLSHYSRGNFETALTNIPQVRSLMRINNIEVWITIEQNNDLRNATTVAAIDFLGESDISKFSDPSTRWQPRAVVTNLLDIDQNRLPDNRNSDLFRELVRDDQTRKIVNTATLLETKYGMKQTRDFEIQNMRKLRSNEYTYYPELGFISLRQRLRPNQVLGISYEYIYSINGNEVYKVGELTNESNRGGVNAQGQPEPEDVVYVKMLKSSNQNPGRPEWDLMMKNIYSLSTSQLTQDEFELDIFFEDNATATLKRYIPEEGFRSEPLLNLFQLDRLNAYNDPQADGIFDFVEGVTVNTSTGSIIFPVLEPFGNSLLELLDGNEELYQKYGFPELYTSTVTKARQTLNKNQFLIKGQLKSNTSSEISLGAFNLPQGSVTVRAGSQILRENIDYDIDYGIGRIKILNESYLQQGVPIRVSFEDQNLFGLQQKTMLGLRGEYRANDNFTIGGTYMNLFERPFTQKVNIGEDPINNVMYGLDLNLTTDAPLITKLVDKLPFISTNAPSTFTLSAEVAAMKPGTSGSINIPGEDEAVVSIDDFEGATSSIPLGSRPNLWNLASTPPRQSESSLVNDLNSGVNRALLNWGVVFDRRVRNSEDQQNPYTRRLDQTELFERQLDVSQLPDLLTFDMHYYPEERGPYNFDVPGGTDFSAGVEYDQLEEKIKLLKPEDRWAGITRYLPNNDFEAANYEYVEFWMLNPFMDRPDSEQIEGENGVIRIHLGNVSEDIIKDNLQFYENAIPIPGETIPEEPTAWGVVPLAIPNVNGFDLQNQELQDLGLDGLSDEAERIHYADYISKIESIGGFLDDPSNDNYVSYLDEVYPDNLSLTAKMRGFNGPQGNAPVRSQTIGLGNPIPDAEDLNGNRSLEQSENFYEYSIILSNENGEIRRSSDDFITDTREIVNQANGQEEKWYRYQIPIMTAGVKVGDIEGFRSIQFMRMTMGLFKTPKTFRLAEFELVRNQWRRLELDNSCTGAGTGSDFIVNEVGLQENGKKQPFNYVLPKGIKQERIFSTFSNLLQDENSLSMRITNIPDSCETMISKLTQVDARQFERLQLFVHAEEAAQEIDDGNLSLFVRFGKDFTNNYYEYEVPLTMSDPDIATASLRATDFQAYSEEVWHPNNKIDFPLSLFTDMKVKRDSLGAFVTEVFKSPQGDPENPRAELRIRGNPSLGNIKGMVIGLRNTSSRRDTTGMPQTDVLLSAEVWVNELRFAGFENRGGVSGIARMDMQLADLGNLTMSANYSSVGWGQIDQQLQERQLESLIEYDIATNLELGKFLPKKWGVKVPFYYQYSKSISSPEFDPLVLDLTKEQLLSNPNLNDNQRLDIEERQEDVTSISTFNFTNVRKERSGDGPPMPWDISNVNASYSFTRTKRRDEIIKSEVADDQRIDVGYGYNAKPLVIQPFKGIKSKALRFIKEININPVPSSFTFNSQMRRFKSQKLYRLPDPSDGFTYIFDDQRFDWTRNYSLAWDLAKSLRLNYDASAVALVDELKQVGIRGTAAERDWESPTGQDFSDQVRNDPGFVDKFRSDNLKDFGRMKTYNQGVSVSYKLPFKYFPGLDWITSQASYNGDYTWNAGSLTARDFNDPAFDLGNIIQNGQRRSLRTTFDFEKLYDKVDYLKLISGKNTRSRSRSKARSDKDADAKEDGERKKPKRTKASAIEKIFLRPLLAIREVKINYSEDFSTVVPGFIPEPKFFGLAQGDPGWGFVFGIQPDIDINNGSNFLRNLEGVISSSRLQNQQVLQNNTQNFEASIDIEPWKDFKIDIDFKKKFTRNHSEYFINVDPAGLPAGADYQQLALRDVGSYEVTYSAMNTLFNSDIDELFTRFENYREIISQRLPNNTTAPHSQDVGYSSGYGRQHVDVLVPAFLAAYTKRDPNTIPLSLTDDIGRRSFLPKPNWKLTFDGLSKLPMFKKIFSSFSITHGYKSTLSVSSYATDLQFDILDPYFIDPDISTGNYFSRFEIPNLVINEQFQPLIGIDIKTQNDLNFNLEFAKSRNLQLSTGLAQLTEARRTSYTVGLEWTLQDVNIGFLTGKKKNSRRRKKPDTEEETDEDSTDERDQRAESKNGVNNEQNRLSIGFNLQFNDDVTYIHDADDGATSTPTRGTTTISIRPNIDYDINKNFTLRFFFDYNRSQPYLSTSYPRTSIQGGLTARFNLD